MLLIVKRKRVRLLPLNVPNLSTHAKEKGLTFL